MSTWEASQRVWPGIEQACGDAVPGPFSRYFRPFDPDAMRESMPGQQDLEALNAFKVAACADFNTIMAEAAKLPAAERAQRIFAGCDFQRFGVVEEADAPAEYVGGLLVFAFHQWMLDEGIEGDTARALSRALFARQAFGFAVEGLPAGFEMPVLGGPLVEVLGPVQVTTSDIRFEDREVTALETGGQLPASAQRNGVIMGLVGDLGMAAEQRRMLAEGRGGRVEPLMLLVDARTPFATLADVIHTAQRADGAEDARYALVAARDQGFGLTAIQVRAWAMARRIEGGVLPSRPRTYDPEANPFDDNPPKRVAFLAIELTKEGLSVSAPGHDETREAFGYDEVAKVETHARALLTAEDRAQTVVLSAAPDVPVSRIIEVLDLAAGSECSGERPTACLLSDALLTRTAAHDYRPSGWSDGDEEDVWGGLTGAEVGEAYGVGGLGLVGTGRGGGTGEGTIGLGNTGLIGKGGGGGSGSGYGSGKKAGFGGGGKSVPSVRQAKAKVTGPLDKDIIRRIVRAHINEVRACYNHGLTKDPELGGRISIEFTIGSSGSVTESAVSGNTLKDRDDDTNVASCVAKAVKRWKFPKPRGGGEVDVVYPFTLSPS